MKLTRVEFHQPLQIAGSMLTSASAPASDINFDEKTTLVTVVTREKKLIVPLSNVKAMHPAETLREAATK